jgi:plastocyanin
MKRILGTNFAAAFVFLTALVLSASCGGDNGATTTSSSSTGKDQGGSSTIAAVENVPCTADAVPVKMINSTFDPYNVTAPVNSVVKWTNYDSNQQHRVVSDETPEGGFFQSNYLPADSYVCFKFTGPGTYNYHCSDHMFGIVTITATP